MQPTAGRWIGILSSKYGAKLFLLSLECFIFLPGSQVKGTDAGSSVVGAGVGSARGYGAGKVLGAKANVIAPGGAGESLGSLGGAISSEVVSDKIGSLDGEN